MTATDPPTPSVCPDCVAERPDDAEIYSDDPDEADRLLREEGFDTAHCRKHYDDPRCDDRYDD